MMDRLRERIDDQQLLELILHYLKADIVLPDGKRELSKIGMPQGGPLSPLLANILLDELDRELEARGHRFVRYADDFLILCYSPRAGRRILDRISRYLQNRLKLTVNTAKSNVVPLREASFLGFTIIKRRVRWTEKSKRKFKTKVRQLTRRTRGVSPRQVMSDLRLYIRGAINYYMPGLTFAEAQSLDRWMRRRIRTYYWKQWGRPRARRRNLIKLGINRSKVHQASRSRKGPWRMSQMSLVHTAINNQWLSEQGAPSIEKQWVSIRYPNGPKPKNKPRSGSRQKKLGDLKA